MKRALSRIIIFLIPIILFFILIEFILRILPNQYKYKDNYVNRHHEEIEVLILGQSQTQGGLIPEDFDLNCFSFAIDGQSIRYDKEIFEKYKDRLTNLKYIVLPINHFSLYFEMTEVVYMSDRAINYPLYLGIKTDEIPFYKRFEFLSPGYKSKLEFVVNTLLSKKNLVTCLPLGNYKLDIIGKYHKSWEERAIKDGKWQSECIRNSVKIRSENELRLKEIIEECGRKGIKVVITNPPVAEIFRITNAHVLQFEFDEHILLSRSLSIIYDNVIHINCFSSVEFTDEDYSSAEHLNAQGAVKFTNIINNAIMQDYLLQH